MPKKKRCPECGTDSPGGFWTSGLCPRCSLLLALDYPSDNVPENIADLGDATLQYPDDPALSSELTLAYPAPVDDSQRELALSPGKILDDRYRVHSRLGEGGMGEVWRAFDLKLRVDVALKSLRVELTADERALEALRSEVRLAREVISPNACRVYDLEELDGQELVSMEYIDGTTLLDVIQERGPLDLSEAREIASQFLAGLEAVHEAGLVHRDMKPENVMLTRAGRVVVMDFGIAKSVSEGEGGLIAGTPAYMPPEQSKGEELDARADVFAAGVVLVEMTAPGGVGEFNQRRAIWEGIHQEVPEVPDTPWSKILTKAVSPRREDRYPGASALARALEEIALRVEGAEELHPYPGLSAFTRDDARYFFGRELEIESMWKKLRRPHLLGLIGPSGAGKSSFVRAGLLPVMPDGWHAIVTAPGNRPFEALAQELAGELEADSDAIKQLLEIENPKVAVEVATTWRQHHDQVLIVLDQFEELFTQNPTEVQSAFSELLARLALDANIHVLLSMRDDFLFHCSDQPALAPVFSELTPLRAPTGAALRRAVVQPALKCGYRFEDEGLVDEILTEVEGERGALPLLAFACARLWEKRNRDEGLLTRQAYEAIGGVAGSLAHHAEATLERIGGNQIPIVREIFRNLVTAQGTRLSRARAELLSVFATGVGTIEAGNSEAAEVLDALIDARLLTSYDVPAAHGEESSQTRVEIVHESLLSNWPRLVRWRSQDAEGAQLRDELRQAAELWGKRGNPRDLLWTGTSLKEYELWRERYGGGLTAGEEAFAAAMTSHAERRKRRRRAMIASAFVVLLVVLAVVLASRQEARQQALRAEASQILALGRLEIEENTTGALAYAIASLERRDDPVTRRFVLDALWRGPTALIPDGLPGEDYLGTSLDFSPDGTRLAIGTFNNLSLWSSAGGSPKVLDDQADLIRTFVRFAPDGESVVAMDYASDKDEVQVWSVPKGELVSSLPSEGQRDFRLAAKPPRIFTFTEDEPHTRVEAWPLAGGEPTRFDNLPGTVFEWSRVNFAWNLNLDAQATKLTYVPFGEGSSGSANEVYLVELNEAGSSPPRFIGRHEDSIARTAFHPDGRHVATADITGEVRIWDLESDSEGPVRVLRQPPARWVRNLRFDSTGSQLATATWARFAALWDLEGPPDAGPMILRRGETWWMLDAAFHPEGTWLATTSWLGTSLWPIIRRYPMVLSGHEGAVRDVVFLPDGSGLVSGSLDHTVRFWPLSADAGSRDRVLLRVESEMFTKLAVDPSSDKLLAAGPSRQLWLIPLDGSPPRQIADLEGPATNIAIAGNQATAYVRHGGEGVLRVWDLESYESRDIEIEGDLWSKLRGGLYLTPENEVLSVSADGLGKWSLEDGSFELHLDFKGFEHPPDFSREGGLELSQDYRYLLVGNQGDQGEALLLDFETGTSTFLDSHGSGTSGRCGAVSSAGWFVVTRPCRPPGDLIVGPIDGGAPHLLIGPDPPSQFTISPDGKWIAATFADDSQTILLWPVPDLAKPPLHTLPLDELLAKLRTLTNLRVAPDPESDTGWGWALDPFPGWEEVPTW